MTSELPPSGTRGPTRLLRAFMRLMSPWGRLIFRRGARAQGRPLLELTTLGARSGKRRATVLAWFPGDDDAGSWIVVGSGGGSAWHPGWVFNLAANPGEVAVDLGDGDIDVGPQFLTGTEREVAWQRVIELAPSYRAYAARTDRELPVIRLTPRRGP